MLSALLEKKRIIKRKQQKTNEDIYLKINRIVCFTFKWEEDLIESPNV